MRYLPSQGGSVGEKRASVGVGVGGVNLTHTRAHTRLIPVRFVREQLSGWKYLLLSNLSHNSYCYEAVFFSP